MKIKSTAVRTDLEVYNLERRTIGLVLYDGDGVSIDLTNFIVSVSVRTTSDPLSLEMWSKILVNADQTVSSGKCSMALYSADLDPVGSHWWEFYVTDNADINQVVAEGLLIVKKSCLTSSGGNSGGDTGTLGDSTATLGGGA